VANTASSVPARQTAMSDAQSLAVQINAAGQQYDSMRASVNTQMSDAVTQINSYTAQIASLNEQITQASSQGQPPNQLLDERDEAVANLSTMIGASVVQNNGSYSVFMSNGQPLVLGGNSFNLGTATSSSDPTELSVQYLGQAGANAGQTPQTLSDTDVSGGTLGGLLQFRSQTLDPAEAQLGAIATSFAAQVNAQNALGVTPNGTAGGALFTVGSPTVYANSQNTGNASLGVSFADPTQPTTGDYTLSYDGNVYTLTDNETGSVVGSASNLSQPIGGLQFSATGTMNAGDSFSVEPTRGALDNFALTTQSGSAIAAAAPVLASASSSNQGGATITQGTVSAGYTAPTFASTITYTAGTGLTGFPANSVVTVSGTPPTSYTINSATDAVPYSASSGATLTITSPADPTQPTDGSNMNNVTVTISGAPDDGDTFSIGPNTGAANDGRNAQLLSNLTNATVLSGGTSTLTGAFADYVNGIGNQTVAVQTAASGQAALVTQITNAQQSVSGVNINEEAANLLQYQQLYQANSKVIQTAQSLFQTLIGIFQ
jgi:flagellar hook-associated protein 1